MTVIPEGSACLDPDDVAALLEARLDPSSMRALEHHAAGCSECRSLLSALAREEAGSAPHGEAAGDPDGTAFAPTMALVERPPELAPGARLGRYVVEAPLGAGAMGAVYVARDPELDRKVALKILGRYGVARDERERVRERLSQEAQAMAQLAHPNVVAVHDVGTVDDHIFIAMELVEGQTLAAWLAAGPRSWRAVVAMFLPAGHGLAAAHNAGLVHRDFKPENVLVGADGRVRVGDFGLARKLASDHPDASEPPPDELGDRSLATGSLAGTPFYMAPEQFLCEAADARSDQFSFCVALYAAIAHHHPFAGEGVAELADAVIENRLRPPPARSLVPRWLFRVLRRGLAREPGDRYPSMDALLAELGRAPRRRRARAAVAGIAVGALGLVAAVLVARDDPQLCTGAEQKWAGVWDAPRTLIVAQAFGSTGKPYAGATYTTVARVLGGYRTGWIAMHGEACEATRVRGDQTEAILERRMLCLDARLRDARALVDRFAVADAETVEHAPIAVGSLGDLASCADLQALSSQVPPPADPVTRARVAQLRGELAELKAARPDARARERIAALVAATATTRYRPLEAEALLAQGAIENAVGDLAAASRAYEQAVWAAEAGRTDEVAAHAWTRLMDVRRAQARFDDGLALAPRVTVLLERLGGSAELEGSLRIASAGILWSLNRFDDARTEAEKARALLEGRFGADDLRVAGALEELAEVANAAARNDDALGYYDRAIAIKQRVFGDDHPEVATLLVQRSFLESMKSRYPDALSTLARAQAIYESTVDANHRSLGHVAYYRGVNYWSLAQLDKAEPQFRRAVAIAAVAYGTDHPNYGAFLMNLGGVLVDLDRPDEALTTLGAALATLEKALGPEHARVARCLEYVTRAHVAREQLAEARATITRAIAIDEKLFGRDNPTLRQPLLALGGLEIKAGAPARAIAPLERAYAFGSDTDVAVYAEVQWNLGRALVEARRDPARGMQLVHAAQAALEKDERAGKLLQQVSEWLGKRRGRR
jgi:tetratricopeptide (TPR) repeat protein